ncbi:MAG: alpha-hydroxy-acid oxidizing protein [Actinobacteria bacterium]|nr:alpha-hydroxy-acid oxidizing protein [Actinomycetota bacterium]
MKPSEIAALVRVGRPPAPYGARRLARAVSIEDVARAARKRLPNGALAYLDGGGEGEYTLRRNRAAFAEHELVPAELHDVSHVDTSTTVLGTPTPLPLALAPVGAPRLFNHEGELAAARAARHARVPYAVSTLATVSLERLRAETDGVLWFQLYLWGDRGKARELVERAQSLGYGALLLSVDVSVRSKRERERRAGVTLPSPHLSLATVLDGALHPSWSWHFLTSDAIGFPNVADGGGRPLKDTDLSSMFDGTVSWHDVEWLREAWRGPLVLKGVLSAPDARRAADAGVDAVVVSNHGGRQLDHVPATIDVLPEIVGEVGDRVEVLLDSGVRRGTDIVTALALGARAVLVGRAYLYGLAAAGEAGVRHAVDILADELRTAMALSGAACVGDLGPELVRRRAATVGRPEHAVGGSESSASGSGPTVPLRRRDRDAGTAVPE